MAVAQNQHIERREHFRINDTLFIQYKAIDETTAKSLGQKIVHHNASEENHDQIQLRSLQTAFTLLTDQINHTDREVARALRLLNEKINILSRALIQPEDHQNRKNVEVNLSGGGLGFLSEQEFEAKAPLEIHLELPSSGVIIQSIAKVISCVKSYPENEHTPFYLRLAFTQMNEQDRDLLIKHILFRQAEELRANNNKLITR